MTSNPENDIRSHAASVAYAIVRVTIETNNISYYNSTGKGWAANCVPNCHYDSLAKATVDKDDICGKHDHDGIHMYYTIRLTTNVDIINLKEEVVPVPRGRTGGGIKVGG